MIYRIMIVEDEPPSMRNIEKNMLSCGVADIEIAARAYNGAEALELIPEVRPHIIFSDVKMPVMDGFSLVEQVRKLYPDILIVILSGYQEFDYVKKALHFELSDYLLKPIDMNELAGLLEKLKASIGQSIYQAMAKYLRACIGQYPADVTPPDVFQRFCVIMVNAGPYCLVNGWQDSKFEHALAKNEIYFQLEGLADRQFTWVFECSSPNLFIAVTGFTDSDEIGISQALSRRFTAGRSNTYITVAYSVAEAPEDIPRSIARVRDRIQLALVPEKSQILDADEGFTLQNPPSISKSDEKMLLAFLEERKLKSFTGALSGLLQKTFAPGVTQHSIQSVLNSIISLLKSNLYELSGDDLPVLESIAAETVSNSPTVSDLTEEFVGKVYDFLVNRNRYPGTDPTTEEVIGSIAEYLDRNYAEPVEFKDLAAKYGISYTYLSTLFKKYNNMTPVKYLLTVRVEKAKELIGSDPDITFRQVAALVGYEDSHYFSRIFRNMTGYSPSEYRTFSSHRHEQ